MNFPQYRMLVNGKSYYRIDSIEQYMEIKVWGKYYEQHNVCAHQYNDKLFIQDLLNGAQFKKVDQSKFDKELQRIRLEYEKI